MRKVLILGAAIGAALASAAMAQKSGDTDAEAKLEQVIDRAIHADGPFLTASERALIERKCGYPAGSWDGQNFSMNNGVLICSNGRKVDDPEVRAMMDAAAPRIQKRVQQAMARTEVVAAIEAVSREAAAEALRELAAEK